MTGRKHPDPVRTVDLVLPDDRDLAEDLAALAVSAVRDADEPLTRERPESLFLPGVPLS